MNNLNPTQLMRASHTIQPRAMFGFIALAFMFAGFSANLKAAVDLSDVPVPVANNINQVQPNIMFTLDDSGSMHWEFLPEQDMRSSIFLHPRPTSPYGGADYANQLPTFDDANVHNFFGRSAANNKLYYNPNTTYKPWVDENGVAFLPANPLAAPYNPRQLAAGVINLTAQQTINAQWFTGPNQATINSVAGNHTFWPITYFNYNSGLRTNFGSYTKVQITAATLTGATFTSPSGVVRTKAQEIQNFANWFTYYRSRILASRAGIGKAFSQLGTTPRVGFGAINVGAATIDGVASPGTMVTGVKPFTGADRTNFFNTLYGHVIPTSGTPLRKAIDQVGQYYSRQDNTGPWGPAPQLACRQSYNILMTDGYWNGAPASGAAGQNVDNMGGPTISGPNNPNYTYAPISPYRDAWTGTLADAAMYYWNRDLHPTLANEVTPNSKDPAFWQHMVNFTVGLGVTGSLANPGDLAALTSGALTWPDPNAGNPQKIDDLWHAALNSRGEFFNASDPEQFAASIADALNNINSRIGAAAANAISNPNISATDNKTFLSSFDPASWTGEIQAYALDINTGQILPTPLWTQGARDQLDAKSTATSDTRRIATFKAGVGVPFQWASLNATQQSQLNSVTTPPGPSDGQTVLQFLRGWRGREMANANCVTNVASPCLYRTRAHILGDAINAEGVAVKIPPYHYLESTNPGYTAHITAMSSRPATLYQAANDGMLHAFDGATGVENWAYIPGLLIPKLRDLSVSNGFTHKYYIDATPVMADADFNFVAGTTPGPGYTADWNTVLVGGLGKGGSGYYALNITSPAAANEASVASKALWEFTDPDMGFSYGRPTIVKTRATGIGWVAIFASGYNNVPQANGGPTGSTSGDGKGHLYVVNVKTGALIKKIDVPDSGTLSNPSGLAHIAAYVDNTDLENTVDWVYGGDLNGHLWRFNFTGSTIASWVVDPLPMAKLKDPSGNPQPVTTVPELGVVSGKAGVKYRMVYVGTGKYYGLSDISNVQRQTMYGLEDKGMGSATLDGRTMLAAASVSNTNTAARANFLQTQDGWYLDLPLAGERANTNPTLNFGVLSFTSNIPSDEPCDIYGGTSWLNYVDYRDGGGVYLSTGATSATRELLGSFIATRVTVLVTAQGGAVAIGIKSSPPGGPPSSRAPANLVFDKPLPKAGSTGRVMWRQLINK